MAHKTFTAPAKADGPTDDGEPTTFDLEGVRASNGEKWKETFTCVDLAPVGVLDELVSSSHIDEKGNRIYNAPSLLAFMGGVLVDDDVARFMAWSKDKDRAVPIETLGEIVMWLSEELVGRPTGR